MNQEIKKDSVRASLASAEGEREARALDQILRDIEAIDQAERPIVEGPRLVLVR
ncbi:MAG: hypothetical protein KF691_11545 [Phycisphaeraceae bacterium]|nr:hypothetical protein [Phycisphaeraceae bacterium]